MFIKFNYLSRDEANQLDLLVKMVDSDDFKIIHIYHDEYLNQYEIIIKVLRWEIIKNITKYINKLYQICKSENKLYRNKDEKMYDGFFVICVDCDEERLIKVIEKTGIFIKRENISIITYELDEYYCECVEKEILYGGKIAIMDLATAISNY